MCRLKVGGTIFPDIGVVRRFLVMMKTFGALNVYGSFLHHMFMVRFEMGDHIGTTVFVSLDSEVQKLVCQTATELIGALKVNRLSPCSQIFI
ncbi:hypothetical protein MKX03_011759 [Papaver bracteatum]|nr:hypothetical protein MKX03_011759 [Papaver bracteatum]